MAVAHGVPLEAARHRKKVRVAFDWTLDIFLRKDSVTFHPPHIPAMDRPQSAGIAGEKRSA